MSGHLDPPLAPRRGRTLRVLAICRISTEHQDRRSLDDQEALLRRYRRRPPRRPGRLDVIASRGSGEYLDRKELAEAEELIESRTFDLVVAEDLGRHLPPRQAPIEICEMCQDSGTRLIAINDHVDTARDDWRLNAFFAVFRHESYNTDTAQRIRRSLRNRFTQGGVVQTFLYGYVKPPGARVRRRGPQGPGRRAGLRRVVPDARGGGLLRRGRRLAQRPGDPARPCLPAGRWDGPGRAARRSTRSSRGSGSATAR